jgi:hypothetical protein
MSELTPAPENNDKTVQQICDIIQAARGQAWRAVNFAMVSAYWEVGRVLVQEEQNGANRAEYGTQLLEKCAARLTAEFGKGFDLSNLRNMRLFYLAFPIRDALSPSYARGQPAGPFFLRSGNYFRKLVYPRIGAAN